MTTSELDPTRPPTGDPAVDPAVDGTVVEPAAERTVVDEPAGPVATPGPDPSAQVVLVDPATLLFEDNVRIDDGLDKEFLASIRDDGVRTPVLARRDPDGRLFVRFGRRRTRAAVLAGLPAIRVVVEDGDVAAADNTVGSVARIIDQLGENRHRRGNTDTEEVLAHQELLELGLTPTAIARRTHTPRVRVKLTTAVAGSRLAAAAMARYELTLDQAAVIAEFDNGPDSGPDDSPDDSTAEADPDRVAERAAAVEAVKLLTVTANNSPAQFEHVAQRLRDDRADASARRERVEQLLAAGVRVIDADQPGAAVRIIGLRATSATPSGALLEPADHAGCPGHAASVEVRRLYGGEQHVRVDYWCTDPDANGHCARWIQPAASTASAAVSAAATDPDSVAAAAEAARVERRRVRDNNAAWVSAATVRREWVRTLLARKTPPRDALRFAVAALARASHELRRAMESGHPTACELLGVTPSGAVYHRARSPIADAVATASTARITIAVLALVLGAAEDGTCRDTWRHPTPDNRVYFAALRDWGYPLSDVEQLVLADTDSDTDVDTEADTEADATADSAADQTAADHTAGDGTPDVGGGADGAAETDGDSAPAVGFGAVPPITAA